MCVFFSCAAVRSPQNQELYCTMFFVVVKILVQFLCVYRSAPVLVIDVCWVFFQLGAHYRAQNQMDWTEIISVNSEQQKNLFINKRCGGKFAINKQNKKSCSIVSYNMIICFMAGTYGVSYWDFTPSMLGFNTDHATP